MSETTGWDAYFALVRTLKWDEVESEEIEYKRATERYLRSVTNEMLSRNVNWIKAANGHDRGNLKNLCGRFAVDALSKWYEKNPEQASAALQELWTQDDDKVPRRDQVISRVSTFAKRIPDDFEVSGSGVRMRLIAGLLMRISAKCYPPFMTTLFGRAYKRVGYPHPSENSEAALYDHALEFLERLVKEAKDRGLDQPRNLLEAQSVVYMIDPPKSGGDTAPDPLPDDRKPQCRGLQGLADELLIERAFLGRIEKLLADKRQVVFQGPPGTGKTYVARKLAECLAGSAQRVRLVQFHPSYAYEDFVQGFRPVLRGGGQPGFELTGGPLLAAAEQARAEPDKRHFLVIDEINRGNLSKVFGELYFLLEYRNEQMSLQYSAKPFSLPDNLYLIGTMNTADRSIALVDLALRRRFHFVEFHPDKPPVAGLLARWLAKHAAEWSWLAAAVDRANEKLSDRQAAIGPSYFMKRNLDDEMVRLIWEHNVLPYVEEHLYGEHDRLREFDLDALRNEDAPPADDGPSDETD